MKARITKRLVDSLKSPESGTEKVYDDALTGFGLIVYASGKRAFFVEYGRKGERRRMVLGQYGALTPDAAREMAKAKLGEVAVGKDPLSEREERAAMPTFGSWRETYIDRVRRTKKQARHDERYLCVKKEAREDKRGKPARPDDRIRQVAERWANRPLDAISRVDVQDGMADVAEHGHTTANRWLASVRACLQAALTDGLIPVNPAMGIKPFREAPPRARVLSDEEFERVLGTFEEIEDTHVKAAFVLLMDTGARKSEALSARWEDFDLEAGTWRIPSPKSGHPQVVPLTADTVQYLRSVPRLGPWFVPGRDAERHRADLRRAWDHVREAAELEGVTIHDLRRTFGLHDARKAGLHIASKLLRHADVRVTEKVYAPLGIEEMRAAAATMRKEREKKVVELRNRRESKA